MMQSSFGLEYGVHPVDGKYDIAITMEEGMDILYVLWCEEFDWRQERFDSLADAMAWIEAMKLVGL